MRPHVSCVASLSCLVALAACSSGSGDGGVGDTPDQLPPAASVVTRTDIRELLRNDVVAPTGITIAPDTGELVLLDASRGVFVLDENRRFQNVATSAELHDQVDADSAFTDIAALGEDRFALTARNDGFLLDLYDGSLRQHFCYVPGFIIPPNPGPIVEQLTESVAFDPTTRRIIAQPITTIDGVVVDTEVATFPITGGEGDDWHPINEPEFLSGAIAVDQDGVLWLCRGTELCRYDLASDTLTLEQTLDRFELDEVTGMTFDNGDLIVLDGPSKTLVRIPAALL